MALSIKPNTRSSALKEDAIKKVRTGHLVKLTVNIPKALRSKFKIEVTRNNTDMSQVILSWIEEYVKQ